MVSEPRRLPPLEHVGSLITCQFDGRTTCLGHLIHSPAHGTYDPMFGKVDVSGADAATHNRLLDAALLEGLDRFCAVGMRGWFYFRRRVGDEPGRVLTWTGMVVSEDVTVRGRRVVFRRGGRTFAGTRDGEVVAFTRIA